MTAQRSIWLASACAFAFAVSLVSGLPAAQSKRGDWERIRPGIGPCNKMQ